MDNWEKLINNLLHNSKQEFDTFWQQLSSDWEESASNWEDNFTNFAQEMENVLTEELNQFVNEVDILVEDFLSLLLDEDFTTRRNGDNENNDSNSNYSDYMVWFEEQKIEPSSRLHPACINCVNYHGRVYGGNLLVCAMHPHGWDDENCPDWEADNPK